MAEKSDAVVLFSGGLDSMIHLVWAQGHFDKVQALYVDFQHRYALKEIEVVKNLCDYFGVQFTILTFPLGWVEQDDCFIPLRNLLLLELATYYSDNIVFGMLYHEDPPDKRPKFVAQMQALLRNQYRDKKYFERDRRITIHTPFASKTKTEMLRWVLSNGIWRSQLVYDTVGCFNQEGKCGQCIGCFSRWVAFQNCGMSERYNYSPAWWGVEQLIAGNKKRQKLLSIGWPLYKWKYLKEIHTAYKHVIPSPLRTAYQVWKTKDRNYFGRALVGDK